MRHGFEEWGMFPNDFEEGGWIVDVLAEREPRRSSSPFSTVQVCEVSFIGTKKETKANARLIAAAPALLEALEEAADYIGDESAGSMGFWELYYAAKKKAGLK